MTIDTTLSNNRRGKGSRKVKVMVKDKRGNELKGTEIKLAPNYRLLLIAHHKVDKDYEDTIDIEDIQWQFNFFYWGAITRLFVASEGVASYYDVDANYIKIFMHELLKAGFIEWLRKYANRYKYLSCLENQYKVYIVTSQRMPEYKFWNPIIAKFISCAPYIIR